MIVYFIRGLPGAGKSTLAVDLIDIMDMANIAATHIEADHWMVDENGEYKFDAGRLDVVHENCRAEYLRAIANKTPYIIVSNVSAEAKYVDWYQEEATKRGYEFVSLIVENRGSRKSAHDVPDKSIENMRRKFDVRL